MMAYLDTDKLSLDLSAGYLGIPPETLQSLVACEWIAPVSLAAGRIPIFRVRDLRMLRDRIMEGAPKVDPERERIRKKHITVKAIIENANSKLKALQEECKHPMAERVNRGDTGNYDPSQNSYWRDCKCPDCGKFWMEDQ